MDELDLNDYCDEEEFIDLNKQEWYELRDSLKSEAIYKYNRKYEKFFDDYDCLTFDFLFDLNEEDYNKENQKKINEENKNKK